jgi:hypothetical protein
MGNQLAVDIPGQTVFALDEPNEEGWRTFTLTDQVAVRFTEDPSGRAEGMQMSQTSVFPKRPGGPADFHESTPIPVRPLVGAYVLPAGQGVLTLKWEEGDLILEDPVGRVTPIVETTTPGIWKTGESPERRLAFALDSDGTVVAMELTEVVELPRVRGRES